MRLLIIGKINSHVNEAGKIAKEKGANVSYAPDIETALEFLRSGKSAELIMIDVELDVKTLIDQLNQEHIHVDVISYGLGSDAKKASLSIKAGAKEYIPLPPDAELIAAVLEAISDDSEEIIYKSAIMQEIMKMVNKVAPSEANVLITGESGTGKELIARYIHNNSKRAKESFIALNCAAIPDNLLESELFGHEKGAFTGATHRRIGKFEESSGGTLLLDEISEMDIRLQAKLLRAIQEKTIDRVGGNTPIKIDLRILATSNRDLREEVKKGTFREDLLFRLNVINLQLPLLKQRTEDIRLFADHFAKKYSILNGVAQISITETGYKKLESYSWPGNVRELENIIHRAVLIADNGKIDENIILPEYTYMNNANSNIAVNSGIDHLVGKTVENV